jgi:hypothetical protein
LVSRQEVVLNPTTDPFVRQVVAFDVFSAKSVLLKKQALAFLQNK